MEPLPPLIGGFLFSRKNTMELNEEFNRRIKEFHTEHRGCGIITFLRNNPEIGEYISNALKEEPWFQTERITFCCFARENSIRLTISIGNFNPKSEKKLLHYARN